MRPGDPEYEKERERRIEDRKLGLNVREEADKRLEQKKKQEEGVNLFTKALTNMQLQKKNKTLQRQSVPNMPTTSNDFSPVRDRARTMG